MGSALDEALLLKQNPDRLFFQQQLPLPDGVAQLIRIAIDPASVTLSAEQRRNLDDAELQGAATAYLKGVCLFPGSQSLRVLGLNAIEDNTTLLEHRRLLLKWLHPDRNPENRHLAERVNRAWSQIKLGTADIANVPQYSGFTAESAAASKPRSGGRFPLFLAGLAVLAASLWVLSLWPDSTEYLGAAPPPPDRTAEAGSDTILPQLPPGTWGEAPAAAPETPAPAPAVNPQPAADVAEIRRSELPGKANGDRQSKGVVETGLTPAVTATAGTSKPPPHAAPDPVPAAIPGLAAAEPVATPSVAVTRPAEQAPTLSTSQAQAALQRFLQLYRDGELPPFMAQFSPDARNNRGGKQAIEEDYSRLFQQSKRRDLAFSDLQWQQVSDGLRLRANFRSKVTYVGQLTAERNSGRIELLFRSEGGQVRIARILVFTG